MHIHQGGLVSAAILLSCTLASLFLIAYSAPPPRLTVSEALACEDGTKVTVSGTLVDYWQYDGGSEALIVADMATRAQMKLVISPGISAQPGSYVSIGDLLEVTGSVSSSKGVGILIASSDGVTLIKGSEQALCVAAVSRCWALFEGDLIELRGRLLWDALSDRLRIQDLAGTCSISLETGTEDVMSSIGQEVLLAGVVRFDVEVASVTISVHSVYVS